MCFGGKKPTPAPAPAPAPPPPADPPAAPVIDGQAASEREGLTSRRTGTSSLRINLASSQPSGGSGINIPGGS